MNVRFAVRSVDLLPHRGTVHPTTAESWARIEESLRTRGLNEDSIAWASGNFHGTIFAMAEHFHDAFAAQMAIMPKYLDAMKTLAAWDE